MTHLMLWGEAGTGPVPSFVRGVLAPKAAMLLPLLLRRCLMAGAIRILAQFWVHYRRSPTARRPGPARLAAPGCDAAGRGFARRVRPRAPNPQVAGAGSACHPTRRVRRFPCGTAGCRAAGPVACAGHRSAGVRFGRDRERGRAAGAATRLRRPGCSATAGSRASTGIPPALRLRRSGRGAGGEVSPPPRQEPGDLHGRRTRDQADRQHLIKNDRPSDRAASLSVMALGHADRCFAFGRDAGRAP